MQLVVKNFEELTNKQVYELLKIRAVIFVEEQKCVYLDMDDVDYESLHVFYEDEEGKVLAYLRLFYEKGSREHVRMGRVVTLNHGQGLGISIVKEGIRLAKEKMGGTEIHIDAQEYAIGFYEKTGFVVTSDVFLEVEIPHVQMVLTLE